MKDYNKLCTSDTNNCTVMAISKALNVPVEEAYKALEAVGRKHGQGCYMPQVRRAVEALGGTVTIRLYERVALEKRVGTMTQNNVGEWFSTGRYIMSTARHAFACVHGTIDDWAANSKAHIDCIYEIHGERHV